MVNPLTKHLLKLTKKFLSLPLILTKNESRFAVSIIVNGGGTTGQLDAMVHGIARALLIVDNDSLSTVIEKPMVC